MTTSTLEPETYVARTIRLVDAMFDGDDGACEELLGLHVQQVTVFAAQALQREGTLSERVSDLVTAITDGVIHELMNTGTLGIAGQAACRGLARLADAKEQTP